MLRKSLLKSLDSTQRCRRIPRAMLSINFKSYHWHRLLFKEITRLAISAIWTTLFFLAYHICCFALVWSVLPVCVYVRRERKSRAYLWLVTSIHVSPDTHTKKLKDSKCTPPRAPVYEGEISAPFFPLPFWISLFLSPFIEFYFSLISLQVIR